MRKKVKPLSADRMRPRAPGERLLLDVFDERTLEIGEENAAEELRLTLRAIAESRLETIH